MALTPVSKKVFEFLKECGDENNTIATIAKSLDMSEKSVNGVLLGLQRKSLIIREEIANAVAEKGKKPIKYIRLTPAAETFDPDEETTTKK